MLEEEDRQINQNLSYNCAMCYEFCDLWSVIVWCDFSEDIVKCRIRQLRSLECPVLCVQISTTEVTPLVIMMMMMMISISKDLPDRMSTSSKPLSRSQRRGSRTTNPWPRWEMQAGNLCSPRSNRSTATVRGNLRDGGDIDA